MGNILLLTFGTDGDVFPFIQIGRELIARGHDVTLLTHCDYEERAHRIGLNFVPIDNHDEYELFLKEGSQVRDPLKDALSYYQRHILPRVIREYRVIEKLHRPGKTVQVFTAMPGLSSWIAAEKLNIPGVSVFIGPNYVTSKLFLEMFISNLNLLDELNRIRSEVGLPLVHNGLSWWRSATRRIGFWPNWFAPPSPDWSVDVEPMGFLIEKTPSQRKDFPAEVQDILDSDEVPILIVGSSGEFFVRSEFYTAATQACHLVGRKGLLVARRKTFIPNSLPSGISYFKYLPFAGLMPHMGAVIHHGGMNTGAQALFSGIPQVILALGADRPDNARRYQHLGVAEHIPPPRWQPEEIADALRRLMNSSEVKARCQELAQRMRATNALAATCDVIESVLSHADPGKDLSSGEYVDARDIRMPEVCSDMRSFAQIEEVSKTDSLLELTERLSPERLELLALLLQEDSKDQQDTRDRNVE